MSELLTYYRGRPVEGLTRDELIEAVETLGAFCNQLIDIRRIDDRDVAYATMLCDQRQRRS